MSEKNSEMSLKYRLMKIIEEELSTLNLEGLSKGKNGHFKDIFQNENKKMVEITKEEDIFSMDRTAEEILHKLNQADTLANKDEDIWKNSSKSVIGVLEEMLKETCLQNEKICIVNDEVFSPPNKIPAGENSKVYNDQHEDAESLNTDTKENIQESNAKSHNYAEVEVHHDKVFTAPSEKIMAKRVTQHRNEPMKSNTTFIPPCDSTAEKIKRQCEFFFQDYNVFKNSYLLSNIKRNKEGYVYLTLLASFRKVKAITRDCRDIAYSLEKSQILELNGDRSKVRRREPLLRLEDTRFGKTVMVFNLPRQNSTPEYLKDLFSKFGAVVSADIFDARDREIDAYQSRCLFYHHQIASRIYGVVEFENFDHVVNCLRDDGGYLTKETEMIVVPLTPQVFRKQKRNLRFLRNYYPSARRTYGRFRQRNEGRYNNEAPTSSGDMRNGNVSSSGYYYQRGYYRRSFRGRNPLIPFGGKNYSEGHIAGEYEGPKSKNWQEIRQLKAGNSLNINRVSGNVHRK